MALLDQLTKDVAAETTVDASVETLLLTLAAEIKNTNGDPVDLKALTDQMEANAAALSAAVTANTPTTSSNIPTVTGVAPNTGSSGTKVVISGTGFTGATVVNFGNSIALPFTVVNDTTINATAPVSSGLNTVDVLVTAPGGKSASGTADQFSYTS